MIQAVQDELWSGLRSKVDTCNVRVGIPGAVLRWCEELHWLTELHEDAFDYGYQ